MRIIPFVHRFYRHICITVKSIETFLKYLIRVLKKKTTLLHVLVSHIPFGDKCEMVTSWHGGVL